MKLKKILAAAAVAAAMTAMTACGSASENINVVTREEGSGTRGAFTELFEIVDADGNDAIIDTAEVTNSTAVMLQTIAGDSNAIGYASMGAVDSSVKILSIDGAAGTIENINNGSYSIARPFNIVTKTEGVSEVAQDFIDFIMSSNGQSIIEEENYIKVSDGSAYTASGKSGKVSLSGSTSVGPVMEILAEEYMKLNPDVQVEVQQTGSSAGITAAIEGVCDIGMSSRDLKDEEISQGLAATTIATDGIAVIVNTENELSGLTSEQVKQIYLGEITDFSEVE
ncbi:MAG: extracellular solute-binding protein [Oscillospiraceae bacterium]|nr:extracellular solute-binding protein [Oscillospiraceae bacterium]